MTYEELQKAYEAAMKKCSELEQKIEEKDLRIEHLTELVLKRNKMLFGAFVNKKLSHSANKKVSQF